MPQSSAPTTAQASAASNPPAKVGPALRPAKKAGAASGRTPQAKPAEPIDKPSKAAKAAAPAGELRSERVKMVRDSFTMPKSDFELIGSLKQRALRLGREVKKSELLRAGLHSMSAMADAAFLGAVSGVPRLKTGRPHHK